MKKLDAFLCFLCVFCSIALLACGNGREPAAGARLEDSQDSGDDDNGGTIPNPPDGSDDDNDDGQKGDFSFPQVPIDALLLEDGSLIVLYTSGNSGHIVWFDALLRPQWVFEGGLNFPHSLDYDGDRLLVADSNNARLALVRPGTATMEEIPLDLAGFDEIFPNGAQYAPDGNIIITDLWGSRIIEIDWTGKALWSLDVPSEDKRPGVHDAKMLPNGNLLFCRSGSNEVVEATRQGEVVWRYSHALAAPRSATRLDNGDTLIADQAWLTEVDPDGVVVWEWKLPFEQGYHARRMADGTTLNGTNVVCLVDADGTVLWQLSEPNPATSKLLKQNPRLLVLKSIGYL